MSDQPNTEADLFKKESQRILNRRQVHGLAESDGAKAPASPHELDPVGLALSGGGIRSATFNLGLLQGMANLGLLKYFDYLSTVSGGGYIGSWWTAWLKREGNLAKVENHLNPEMSEQELVSKDKRPQEPEPIRYLRRHSNYLAPRVGFLSADTWVLWASYLRNFLLTQLLLFPTVIAVLLLTRILLVIYHPDASLALPVPDGLPEPWGVVPSIEHRPHFKLLVWMEYIVGGLVCSLWVAAAFFAFLGAARVRLAEVKHEDNTSGIRSSYSGRTTPRPLGPRTLFWGILVPLTASAVLLCWIPASRLLVAEMRGGGQRNAYDSDLAEYLCFALLPPIVGVLAYKAALLCHRQFRGWGWHLVAVFAAGALGGTMLYFVGIFLQYLSQPGPFELHDYAKARAAARITTFGPPFVLGVFVLTIFAGVALLRHRLGQELREWWSSVCARLMIVMTVWLVVTFISLYATAQLIWAGPWIQAAIGSGWVLAVTSGVLAGGSSVTGGDPKAARGAELLARLAPPAFVIGIIVGISLLLPVMLDEHPDWSEIAWQMEVLRRSEPENPPTKIANLTVQEFKNGDASGKASAVHERRRLEERSEVLSDSEMASYLYWMGMFHVSFNASHLPNFVPQILLEDLFHRSDHVDASEAAPQKAEDFQKAEIKQSKADESPKTDGKEASPPLKDQQEHAAFRLRFQDMHALLNASRGKSIPQKVKLLTKKTYATPMEFKKEIEASELSQLFDSEKDKDAWIAGVAKKNVWKPQVRYKLYPEDMLFLRSRFEDDLPKGIKALVNQSYTREQFQKKLSENEKDLRRVFRDEKPFGEHSHQIQMERLAKDAVLIDFAPGMLLLKDGLALCLCLVVLLVGAWRVDVNLYSLNAVDGNRLVRAYLGASRKDRQPDLITGFDPDDDLALSDLLIRTPETEGYDGPYYIINTALNLVHAEDLSWQERQAESFVFTPDFCGSDTTGYRPTEQYAGGVSVGTAVAISGAAASPNSGFHSSPAITALLTIFNARMGAWLGNPQREPYWKGRGPRLGYVHLLKELFGLTDDKSAYVYLSDGGHFENLGVYELVRRRCRFIVSCDAGCDPQHTFEDLGSLIRKVRVDFGIRIEIDHSSLKKAVGQNRTQWHCAVGQIRYDDVFGDAVPGILVYIKPCLSGDEPADVLQYASEHPTFPQEPTSDQFFSESQFESYRGLGQHVAEAVLAEAVDEMIRAETRKLGESLRESHNRQCRVLFSSLSRRWFAMPPEYENSFIDSTHGYADLQQTLAKDDGMRRLTADMYPELETNLGKSILQEANAPNDFGHEPGELHTMLRMVQTMENAWLSLNLESNYAHPLNRGWMDVFFRWTNSTAFRRCWPFIRSEFAQRFVNFCERQMRLGQVTVRLEPLKGKVPKVLCQEFAHQWPSFTGGLSSLLDHLAKGPDNEPLAWLFHLTMDEHTSAIPFGLALILEKQKAANASAPPIHELLIWIRGAYRNSGNGRKAMEQVLSSLRAKWTNAYILQVRLPNREVTGPGGKLLKRMWLTFFHHHDFRRTRPQAVKEIEILLERTFPRIIATSTSKKEGNS